MMYTHVDIILNLKGMPLYKRTMHGVDDMLCDKNIVWSCVLHEFCDMRRSLHVLVSVRGNAAARTFPKKSGHSFWYI